MNVAVQRGGRERIVCEEIPAYAVTRKERQQYSDVAYE